MKEYNKNSKILRKELQDERIENIKQIAETTLIHNGMLVDKSVNALTWEIDAMECEKRYATSKLPEYSE